MGLLVNTRQTLLPDPTKDAVVAIFFCLQDERLAAHTAAPALHGGYHPGSVRRGRGVDGRTKKNVGCVGTTQASWRSRTAMAPPPLRASA
jgi:hypothetical protein